MAVSAGSGEGSVVAMGTGAFVDTGGMLVAGAWAGAQAVKKVLMMSKLTIVIWRLDFIYLPRLNRSNSFEKYAKI